MQRIVAVCAVVLCVGCPAPPRETTVRKVVVGTPPFPPPASKPNPEPVSVPGLVWVPISARVEMARTEATVGQYRACVEQGACADNMLHGIDWPNVVPFEPRRECTWPQGDDELPVNCVAYADALAYCRFVGGRLPTVEEWLAAASNGRSTRWPWGDEPGPDCSHAVVGMPGAECARTNPRRVCSRPAGNNLLGICDLVGNLYEWTARPGEGKTPWVMVGECYNNFVPSPSLEEMKLEIDDERYRAPPLGIRCVRDRPAAAGERSAR